MTSRPSPAIRLLGAALLLGLPFTPALATTASVRVAQAAPPAPQPPASLTVPVPQAPAAGPDEARRDERRDDRRAFVEAGIAALHAGLLLTPAQQGLWPPVETALRDLAATRGGMRHDREEGRDTDPVARLRERATRLVGRGQAMGRLSDAATPLYAALTPEQKERVPRLLHRIMRPGRMMDGMRGGRHGMDRPGMDRPGMDRPGMDGRGMDGRGMDGRGMDRRGMEEGDRFRGGGRHGRSDGDRG